VFLEQYFFSFLGLMFLIKSYRPLKSSEKYPAITTIGMANPLSHQIDKKRFPEVLSTNFTGYVKIKVDFEINPRRR
jgi:hypothetical protein